MNAKRKFTVLAQNISGAWAKYRNVTNVPGLCKYLKQHNFIQANVYDKETRAFVEKIIL